MNRGALCAPKDTFPLILRLQSSNDVCTQSGLVLLFVHFEACTPTLSHFVHRHYTFHQEILEILIRHYEPPKCIVDGHLRYELVTIL